MKMIKIEFLWALLIIITIACTPQDNHDQVLHESGMMDMPLYDSAAASKYGADEYGMKKFVIAFLYKGPNRDIDSLEAAKLQNGHMENINRLAENRKLVLAGAFVGDGDLRGIYVFDVGSIAEAQALTGSDPAIQAGSLRMDLKKWYGSAALMAINDIHSTLSKSNY